MKKFILILLAALLYLEQDQVKDLLNSPDPVIEAEDRELYAPDTHVAIPQDGDLWHTVLILEPDWRRKPEQVKIHNWFHGSNKALTNMVKPGVTKFHYHTSASREYRYSWYSGYDAKTRTRGAPVLVPPALCLVEPSGKKIFMSDGFSTAKNLIYQMNLAIQNHELAGVQLFPNRPKIFPLRPKPCPVPEKKPERRRRFQPKKVEPEEKPDYSNYLVVIAVLGGLYILVKRSKK